jgi:hypothetical protein
MDDSNRLALILKFLIERWDSITSILTEDQKAYLQKEIVKLTTRLQDSSNDNDQTKVIAKNFLPIFDNIESLKFLTELDDSKLRSGDFFNKPIDDLEEDVALKLLNSLKKFKERNEQL